MKSSDIGPSSSSVWHRRILIVGASCLWFVVISLPAIALYLAMRGELVWRRGDHVLDRVWLVKERSERGIGWASTRLERQGHETVCLATRVSFWLWEGSSSELGTTYCECYRRQSGQSMELDYLSSC